MLVAHLASLDGGEGMGVAVFFLMWNSVMTMQKRFFFMMTPLKRPRAIFISVSEG